MPSRGRPPKSPDERRDRVLRVRMKQEDYDRFASCTQGQTMSEVVRMLIRQYVRQIERRKTAESWRTW